MSNSYFQFKQFIVHQDKTAMKVGTDGVLLGALASPSGCFTDSIHAYASTDSVPSAPSPSLNILDIGTGTGLVALMLAQRFNSAHIDAVEIDTLACEQATENFHLSSFCSRLNAINADIKDFSASPDYQSRYNLIVSNPPYFVDSLKTPDAQRNLARHTDSLSFDDLAHSISLLLTANGISAIIIPADARQSLLNSFANNGLYPVSEVIIRPNLVKPAKRIVISFSFIKTNDILSTELFIEQAPRVYTTQFKSLLKDFYLNF